MYGFNAKAGCIAAIDLESVRVNVAIVDFGLRILHEASSDDIDVTRGPEATLSHIKNLVMEALRAAGVRPALVRGIGMGVPGPVSFRRALPTSLSLMPGWERYPIREFWKAHFACPVYADNNVYTMALGRTRARSVVGAARHDLRQDRQRHRRWHLCDGEIYRGATEHAGEIGHTNIGHDILCYCGNRGCLEAIAGGRAIARQAEEHARAGNSEGLAAVLESKGGLGFGDVIKAVHESDPIAVALIRESGNAIGRVLAGVVNFFGPSHIVIGGRVAQAGDALLAAIRQSVYQYALPLSTRTLTIKKSAVGAQVGVLRRGYPGARSGCSEPVHGTPSSVARHPKPEKSDSKTPLRAGVIMVDDRKASRHYSEGDRPQQGYGGRHRAEGRQLHAEGGRDTRPRRRERRRQIDADQDPVGSDPGRA